jgi:hypothetical protein
MACTVRWFRVGHQGSPWPAPSATRTSAAATRGWPSPRGASPTSARSRRACTWATGATAPARLLGRPPLSRGRAVRDRGDRPGGRLPRRERPRRPDLRRRAAVGRALARRAAARRARRPRPGQAVHGGGHLCRLPRLVPRAPEGPRRDQERDRGPHPAGAGSAGRGQADRQADPRLARASGRLAAADARQSQPCPEPSRIRRISGLRDGPGTPRHRKPRPDGPQGGAQPRLPRGQAAERHRVAPGEGVQGRRRRASALPQ